MSKYTLKERDIFHMFTPKLYLFIIFYLILFLIYLLFHLFGDSTSGKPY